MRSGQHGLWMTFAHTRKSIFAGDTGYRTVRHGDEEKDPVWPAFTEGGERFGGFNLALFPIEFASGIAFIPVHFAC